MENEQRPAPLRPTLVPFRERWMGLLDFEKMWSTDKELPYLDHDEEPLGTWVGIGEFSGDVIPRKANCDPLPGLVSGRWEGAAALTIVGNDLLGIVAPKDTSDPAVWFWVTSGAVTRFSAEAESSSRPVITISAEGWVGSPHEPDRAFQGWSLRVRDVARLEQPCWQRTVHDNISLEARQEASLLDALRTFEVVESGSSPQPSDGSIPEPASLGGADVGNEEDAIRSLPEQWIEKLARKPVSITGAILNAPLEKCARGYNKQRVSALGMACALASREVPTGGIPYSEIEGEEAVGSWLGMGAFVGRAALGDNDSSLPVQEVTVLGTCALTLVEGRLLGIVDADDEAKQLLGIGGGPQERQSVWFAAERARVKVTTKGEQGLFTKRPSLIEISTDDWDLHLRHVYKLTRACTPEIALKHNSGQPRGENSLVATLGTG